MFLPMGRCCITSDYNWVLQQVCVPVVKKSSVSVQSVDDLSTGTIHLMIVHRIYLILLQDQFSMVWFHPACILPPIFSCSNVNAWNGYQYFWLGLEWWSLAVNGGESVWYLLPAWHDFVTQSFWRVSLSWNQPCLECLSSVGETSRSHSVVVVVVGWIRLIVIFQPLMLISLTVGWIRWCMQLYACKLCGPVLFGPKIYARQFWGAKPPIQFRHRWAESNHSDHLYWPRAAQSVAWLINAKLKPKPNLPFFTSLVWCSRGSNPGLPHPERTL